MERSCQVELTCYDFPFRIVHIYGLPDLESDDPLRLATQDPMDLLLGSRHYDRRVSEKFTVTKIPVLSRLLYLHVVS
jgi:hypothetical protein